MFDAIEEVDELVSASTGIFSRLGALGIKRLHKGNMKDTDQEENTNARKYYVCRRKSLKSKY